jgi:hypothetical protein
MICQRISGLFIISIIQHSHREELLIPGSTLKPEDHPFQFPATDYSAFYVWRLRTCHALVTRYQ